MTGRNRSLSLALLVLPLLAGCGAGVLPTVHSEAERLEVAHQLVQRGKYSTASELLKVYVMSNGGSADVDDAIYLLGECYLRMKDWPAARGEFERLLRDYPESDSSGSASFRLGEAMFGQARPSDFDQEYTLKALDQWQSYLRAYPGHWLNPEAQTRIALTRRRLATKMLDTARLYLKLKLVQPARVYFARVEQEYEDLGLAGEAMIGQALCDVREGKREAAIERLKQVEERFRGQPAGLEAARERARLQR